MSAPNPSNGRSSPPSSGTGSRRRSSITGQFVDLFGPGRSAGTAPTSAGPPFPSSATAAAAQAQRRRLSLSTVGLAAASPSQPSPSIFNQAAPFATTRRDSSSSTSPGPSGPASNAGSSYSPVDENPFEEGDAPIPSTPFARRMSFGARAMRDNMQQRSSTGAVTSPGSAAGRGQGFDFAENMRSRAERSSMSAASAHAAAVSAASAPKPSTPPAVHHRAKSDAAMERPKPTKRQPVKPDAFQERILKGDFYMD
ncbi:hypothetical protein EJ06DRAFT_545720 [Trichodelitschia bisporula]|uniref:Uncharacterized protein n=1 Tax=Trichodelitschia bisporula TaxID=703511 RepID=A0A6G1IAK3_9PEZI|nr:hypothetical protein EJ06DRAFT_545720 [Trichodelitschia bisporula]